MSLYECKVPGTADKWTDCSVQDCARERRINKGMDPVLRLEQYKLKLESGTQLNDLEQQDLEDIAQHVRAVVESFTAALEEAFAPMLEAIVPVLRSLWEGLPEWMKVDVMKEATPRLEFQLNPEVFGDQQPRADIAGFVQRNQPRIMGLN
ncbi:hypothetical protein SEA_JEMERALD_57 [Microbacterium phage Jemerald]|nr:hypothetical protein SEA_JUICER_57 [Microbacterium phage Juicer]WNO27296.1 hypothetical protein SEA_JEMERALD_57 [Microbacterium phage Jemerald]